jgi:tRNA modification GTPase
MTTSSATETIVALATPPGRGALALVRLSGPQAWPILAACVATGNAGEDTPAFTLRPRRATRVRLQHPTTQAALDDALVTWFPAPHSYTGDDVVEVSTHGGAVVPAAVIGGFLAAGARPAAPGEFTRRAFLAGKIDLLQAEATADLIDARSTALQQAALRQLDGGLSRRLAALRQQCLGLEALLAYDIDFPEEDDGPIPAARVSDAVDALLQALDALLATAPAMPLLREGAIVVLAGVPNAGKSSLFNALLGEARAIVTAVPGTTRDALDVTLDTPGAPLRLVDTAGLRDTTDAVERLGIEVSHQWLQRAHVILACGEDVPSVAATVSAIAQALGTDGCQPSGGAAASTVSPSIVRVLTKQDLTDDASRAPDNTFVATSVETGTGLSAVLSAVRACVERDHGLAPVDAPALTRERHHAAVRTARTELAAFQAAWNQGRGVPALIASVHVRAAVEALDDLIGVVSLDDVLDRLFGDFCVGK